MYWRTLAGFMPVFLLTGAIPNSSGAECSSSVDPSEGWKVTSGSKDVALYSRARAGSRMKEFRAIGSIDAPTYSIYTDTGGMIPAFIANRASGIGISKLFVALRKQARNPKYTARQL